MSVRNYINQPEGSILNFLKKATTDKNSLQFAELFNNLLKMFVDCDKAKNGTVDKRRFNELVDTAALTPRLYGFAPSEEEMFKTKADKDASRKALFEAMNEKGDGRITFNEFLAYTLKHIEGKATPMVAHPNLESAGKDDFLNNVKLAGYKGSAQHEDFYWYLLEIFLACAGKDLTANLNAFTLAVSKAIAPAKKLGLFTAELKADKMQAVFSKVAKKKTMTWAEFLGYCEDQLFKNLAL
jgi:Ca2+-binding EF-hand superfamily protein